MRCVAARRHAAPERAAGAVVRPGHPADPPAGVGAVAGAGSEDAGDRGMTAPERPIFSVIMPTRNRSSLFAAALQSVLDQRCPNVEIIVVNDGSAPEHEARYRELVAAAPAARMFALVARDNGHGQSYGLNYGAAAACGDYLTFLDDDDYWTDPQHLARAAAAIDAAPARPELVLANQQAFRNGVPVAGAVWVEDLVGRLRGEPDAGGAYVVTPTDLLACAAHCHLNTTIVARDFYLRLGGLDEELRYECDRDFYLRAIDSAGLIKYLPDTVSRHNIPDPAAKSAMSTIQSELSKRLYQLRLLDKAVLFSARPELRHYAKRQRAYIIKHIATEAARLGRLDGAAYYARGGLAAKFTVGWLGMTMLFLLRRLLRGEVV
jgi:glycosyltransferase involved in cell wall biosynthesis